MSSIECGCLETDLQEGPTGSVPSGVTAMTTNTRYSDDLRPTLACVNDQPERTARWPERWMIHGPDGSSAMYLVNCRCSALYNKGPRELSGPDVMTALTFPRPVNEGSRFLEWLHE